MKKSLSGNIHRHVFESDAITKHNAEEVQALCYLKLLYPSKQCNLIRGNCLGHYVDFSCDGSQSDLCHEELPQEYCICIPTVFCLSRTLDHTLLLKIPPCTPMATPSGGVGGTKPSCLFPSEPFQQVKALFISPRLRKKQMKTVFYESLPNNLTYFAFSSNQTVERYVGSGR